MRVFVSVHDKLGDLLVSTPVFTALREAGCRVTVSTPPHWHEALRLNDDVAGCVDSVRGAAFARRGSLWAYLLRNRFDAVLALREHASVLMLPALFAGVRTRVGRTDKWYGRLMTANLWEGWRWDEWRGPDGIRHTCENRLRAAEALLDRPLPRPPMRLPYAPEDATEARRLVPEEGYFVVHPGTGGTSRRYDAERYAEAAAILARDAGLLPVVTGGPGEEALAACVAEGCGGRAVAGRMSVPTLAAVVDRARVVLCGGTGVLHVAATQRTPAVLVEPTSGSFDRAEVWRPWQTPSRLVVATAVCAGCSPDACDRSGTACVDSIPPARVAAAARELLE